MKNLLKENPEDICNSERCSDMKQHYKKTNTWSERELMFFVSVCSRQSFIMVMLKSSFVIREEVKLRSKKQHSCG